MLPAGLSERKIRVIRSAQFAAYVTAQYALYPAHAAYKLLTEYLWLCHGRRTIG